MNSKHVLYLSRNSTMTFIRNLIHPVSAVEAAWRIVEQLLGLHRKTRFEPSYGDGYIDPP